MKPKANGKGPKLVQSKLKGPTPKPAKVFNPASPRRLAARIKENEACALRLTGMSYPEIAKEMHTSTSQAYALIMRVLERENEELREKVPIARKIELDRLDKYLLKLKGRIDKGDDKAIDLALKIGVRRSKLVGLDAPIQIDPLAGEGGAVAVDLFRKMLENAEGGN